MWRHNWLFLTSANTWRKMDVKATLCTYWEKRINIKWKKNIQMHILQTYLQMLKMTFHYCCQISDIIWYVLFNSDGKNMVHLWKSGCHSSSIMMCWFWARLSISHLELGLLKNSRLPFFDTIYWACQNLQVWIILFIIFLFSSNNKDGKKVHFQNKK